MSTISSVQSYGSPSFRPQAPTGSDLRPERRDPRPTASDDAAGATLSERDVASPSRPDPTSVETRIDDLIARQVSSGSLTSGQADELRTALSAPPEEADRNPAAANPAEPQQPPRPSSRRYDARPERAQGETEPDREAVLRQFVEQLRQNAPSGYSAAGAATRTARALVFDVSA